ncbi:hypothetical protein P7K49_033590 [Saguinus oedipus]|uniref:Uncharacterized protein n=1 Tax=Saguinus oedipus TaxID=9490 RepID=A0ABQ9TTE0_SAGOE|nr:hypothetical protein P7K49_033590 [Saguinus oedipus]
MAKPPTHILTSPGLGEPSRRTRFQFPAGSASMRTDNPAHTTRPLPSTPQASIKLPSPDSSSPTLQKLDLHRRPSLEPRIPVRVHTGLRIQPRPHDPSSSGHQDPREPPPPPLHGSPPPAPYHVDKGYPSKSPAVWTRVTHPPQDSPRSRIHADPEPSPRPHGFPHPQPRLLPPTQSRDMSPGSQAGRRRPGRVCRFGLSGRWAGASPGCSPRLAHAGARPPPAILVQHRGRGQRLTWR